MHIVPSTSAEATISKLRLIFSTFGLPDQFTSDNGTGFMSAEFRTFLSANGIRQILTSPYHPSSNRLAERAVQTFKQSETHYVSFQVQGYPTYNHALVSPLRNF